MADEKTFTQADIDKAVNDALAKIQASVDKLETKNDELVGEVRKYKQQARAASEIKPEDLQAAEDRADKAETALADATKQIKTLTTERDKAVSALETEQGAARTYALEAELASAIAEGNVVPGLVPGFKAMMAGTAKAELVDGKYSVTIGDKPARDHIKSFLDSDDGKAWRAANHNSGTSAPGGRGIGGGAKTVTRAEFDAMSHPDRSTFAKDGGKVVDAV